MIPFNQVRGGAMPDNGAFCINGIGIFGEREGRHRIIPPIAATRFFHSFLFLHDPLVVTIDGRETRFGANTLMAWDHRHVVDYGSAGDRWRLSWLQCWGQRVRARLGRSGLPLNQPIVLADDACIARHFTPMFEEIGRYAHPSPDILAALFDAFTYDILRQMREPATAASLIPPVMREALMYIEAHYAEALTLERLSGRANLSPGYFCRFFQKTYHCPPMHYVIGLRMREAAARLADRSLRIGEIAIRVGYEDAAQFSKIFKRHFGESPESYRTRLTGCTGNEKRLLR